MSTDLRARYTNQRVMTATPGQRIVMLYDRLALDLRRASGENGVGSGSGQAPAITSTGPTESGVVPRQKTGSAAEAAARSTPEAIADNIDHAMQILAELAGSLRPQPGATDSPVENLSQLYGYLLSELSAARSGETARLPGALGIVETLRAAWTEAVASTTSATTDSGSRVG